MAGLRDFLASNQNDRWFSLNTGQRAKVLFLRELKDAVWVVEHMSPENWKRRLVCTADEGRCYGCEQSLLVSFSGWKQKPKLYIDAYVDDGYEQYTAIVSQTLTPTALTIPLVEYYHDNGSITGRYFEVTKTGQGKRGKYNLLPLEEGSPPEKTNSLKLQKNITELEYAKQENYYRN